MATTVECLEDEIRDYLLDVGKNEIVSHRFRILVKEAGVVEIFKLSPLNPKQLELPLEAEKVSDHFKNPRTEEVNHESTIRASWRRAFNEGPA